MRQNWSSQGTNYGGQLFFAATTTVPFNVTIPLYLLSVEKPVRKPKITQVNTIPIHDEQGVSDWTTHTLFYGSQPPVVTTISGFFLTPTSATTDGITHLTYHQMDPTDTGIATGTSLGLQGYSYGDVIWGYLSGRFNQTGVNIFKRTDPTTYTDAFGNVYNQVVLQSFQCDYTVNTSKQTFNMTLYLET